MLNQLASYPAVALIWLLHFLPLPLLAGLGRGFGRLLYSIAGRRRKIASTNLALCFPELDTAQRDQLTRTHFEMLGRSILERGILWWSSRQRIARLVQVVGAEKIDALRASGRPVILLAPHFVGLDAGGIGIALSFDVVSIYATQTNALLDRLLYRGRQRFGDQLLLSRGDGSRATVKAMKSGRPFYYLPDLNFRRKESIFVPFFGVPAATITGLSRLSKAAGAAVVPCVTRLLPGGQGYRVEISDPWTDYPSTDVKADTARMNKWIEEAIKTMPEQYYWVHRRFKTRPLGETPPY